MRVHELLWLQRIVKVRLYLLLGKHEQLSRRLLLNKIWLRFSKSLFPFQNSGLCLVLLKFVRQYILKWEPLGQLVLVSILHHFAFITVLVVVDLLPEELSVGASRVVNGLGHVLPSLPVFKLHGLHLSDQKRFDGRNTILSVYFKSPPVLWDWPSSNIFSWLHIQPVWQSLRLLENIFGSCIDAHVFALLGRLTLFGLWDHADRRTSRNTCNVFLCYLHLIFSLA